MKKKAIQSLKAKGVIWGEGSPNYWCIEEKQNILSQELKINKFYIEIKKENEKQPINSYSYSDFQEACFEMKKKIEELAVGMCIQFYILCPYILCSKASDRIILFEYIKTQQECDVERRKK